MLQKICKVENKQSVAHFMGQSVVSTARFINLNKVFLENDFGHDLFNTWIVKIKGLWNTEERKGDGKYNPLSHNVEGCNPFAATVWEGELLRRHFSPKVRDGVKLLEKSISQA